MACGVSATKPTVIALFTLAAWLPAATIADAPLGWIHSNNTSAYTANKYSFELSLSKLKVNDTIDFLNFREDLLAGQQRLVGNSGDLDGEGLEFHLGLTSDLDVFYKRQQQDFTVDLGPISSIEQVDISKSLESTMESAGLKWIFWRGNLLNPDNRVSAAALEISGTRSNTKNFDLVVKEIRLPNLTVLFTNPQTFSVANLEDEGWKAKLIYSWPLRINENTVVSLWGGFGEATATAATTSDITSVTVKRFFEQQFETKEEYFYGGAGLTLSITPRLPLTVSYEYIRINDRQFSRVPPVSSAGLPSFLTQAPAGKTTNHTFSANLAYWLTPKVHLSAIGNLYSNQFLGVLPHYSNPLSGSFSDKPYGFVGLQLGFNF